MIDPGVLVRRYLLTISAVTSQLGNYTGTQLDGSGAIVRGSLPEQADPENIGPVIQIQMQGGPGHSEITKILRPRIMVRCWAAPNGQTVAWTIFRAVYDVLGNANNVKTSDGRIVTSLAESAGQDGEDPDTGWAFVTGFFNMVLAES